jgi:hypothetical protein
LATDIKVVAEIVLDPMKQQGASLYRCVAIAQILTIKHSELAND